MEYLMYAKGMTQSSADGDDAPLFHNWRRWMNWRSLSAKLSLLASWWPCHINGPSTVERWPVFIILLIFEFLCMLPYSRWPKPKTLHETGWSALRIFCCVIDLSEGIDIASNAWWWRFPWYWVEYAQDVTEWFGIIPPGFWTTKAGIDPKTVVRILAITLNIDAFCCAAVTHIFRGIFSTVDAAAMLDKLLFTY